MSIRRIFACIMICTSVWITAHLTQPLPNISDNGSAFIMADRDKCYQINPKYQTVCLGGLF